uniref:Small auxin up regulated protein n=1 Tax=Kalanchoe fedtschenkoi TaxID=63787 RepID=A0A7N0V5H5_KALFE
MKACRSKWRRIGYGSCRSKAEAGGGSLCYELSQWVSWWRPFSVQEVQKNVPGDVPKGHVAVYVGEEHKRYVIKISLLKHSLLQALLDQAHDCAYDLATEPKLCVPCDEYVFLEVVRCANVPQHGRLLMCR